MIKNSAKTLFELACDRIIRDSIPYNPARLPAEINNKLVRKKRELECGQVSSQMVKLEESREYSEWGWTGGLQSLNELHEYISINMRHYEEESRKKIHNGLPVVCPYAFYYLKQEPDFKTWFDYDRWYNAHNYLLNDKIFDACRDLLAN